jgi:hypothetical protein
MNPMIVSARLLSDDMKLWFEEIDITGWIETAKKEYIHDLVHDVYNEEIAPSVIAYLIEHDSWQANEIKNYCAYHAMDMVIEVDKQNLVYWIAYDLYPENL